jgi:hypothetical protein
VPGLDDGIDVGAEIDADFKVSDQQNELFYGQKITSICAWHRFYN